jgi:hypothetical protein
MESCQENRHIKKRAVRRIDISQRRAVRRIEISQRRAVRRAVRRTDISQGKRSGE